MKKFLIAILSGILLFTSCTENQNTDSLWTSISSYTFGSKGGEKIGISVKSSGEWTVQPSADWIITETINKDSLVISANANETGEYRNGTVTVTSGTAVSEILIEQMDDRFNGLIVDLPFTPIYGAAISNNGRYVAGVIHELVGADEWKRTPLVIDLQTGEKTYLEPSEKYLGVQAISDDAKTIVFTDVPNALCYLNIDGQEQEIILPEGCRNPGISAMSADGSIMVGYCQREYFNLPIKWINGEPEILDYPTDTPSGFELTNGCMARGCSADGNVIYGSEWDSFGFMYWIEGDLNYISRDIAEPDGENLVPTLVLFAENLNISNNGNYIGLSYGTAWEKIPVVLDTRKGEYSVIENISDGSGLGASDNGYIFCGSPSVGNLYGHVYDINTNTTYSTSEFFKDKYGITLSDDRIITKTNTSNTVFFGLRAQSVAGLGTPNYNYWYIIPDQDAVLE